MCKKITIEVEDGLVKSIGINSEWVTFHTDDGDKITLERYTLERGIACCNASYQDAANSHLKGGDHDSNHIDIEITEWERGFVIP